MFVIIRFPDEATECKALGYMAGRFSFKSWDNGETMVPDYALPQLAHAGIRFSVEGPVSYDKLVPPIRVPSPTSV